MTSELDFREMLLANPADAHTRLVYADWLDEARRHLDAALQRVLAHPDADAPRLAYADVCEREGDAVRAKFVRDQIRVRAMSPGPLRDLTEMKCRIIGETLYPSLDWCAQVVERGFVDRVTCSWFDWCQQGDRICKEQPVRTVVLEDQPNLLYCTIVNVAGRYVHLSEEEILVASCTRDSSREIVIASFAMHRRWPTVVEFKFPGQ